MNRNWRRYRIQIFALLLHLAVSGYSLAQIKNQDAEAFKQQFKQQQKEYKDAFQQDYLKYKQQFRQQLFDYKQDINKQWGFAEVSTANKLVIYSKNRINKLRVDYRNNELVASTLNQNALAELEEFVLATLKQSVAKIQSYGQFPASGSGNADFSLAESLGISLSQVPQLAKNLVHSGKELPVSESVSGVLSDVILQMTKLDQLMLESDETEQRADRKYLRSLTTEKIKLEQKRESTQTDPRYKDTRVRKLPVRKNRWLRANLYTPYVAEYANQYQLPKALIYAIIETESSFNPKAISPIPAFGLMQIVPTSFGASVNRRLNNNNNAPSAELLFNSADNVMFGSTFINILLSRYFKQIDSEESKLFCAIAAYNTGPSNVARTFNGGSNSNLRQASEKINSMSSTEVKQHLEGHLPYEEARQYLSKVLSAMAFYNNPPA
jgi:membrane-bound lytic murein transglycosylase C